MTSLNAPLVESGAKAIRGDDFCEEAFMETATGSLFYGVHDGDSHPRPKLLVDQV